MSERALWALWIFGLSACTIPLPPADLVFRNGATAEDVAIRGERIVAVGTRSEVEPYLGAVTRIIDLDGGLLLPAFHDDEVELLAGARSLDEVWLGDAETHGEILEIVRVYATTHPELEIIRGYGWRYHIFEEDRRGELEAVVSDRPVVLASQDGRSSWTNRRGFALDVVYGNDAEARALGRAVNYLHRFASPAFARRKRARVPRRSTCASFRRTRGRTSFGSRLGPHPRTGCPLKDERSRSEVFSVRALGSFSAADGPMAGWTHFPGSTRWSRGRISMAVPKAGGIRRNG